MAKAKPSNTTEQGSEERPAEEKVYTKPNTAVDEIVIDDIMTEGSMRSHFFRPAVICGCCEACGTAKYVGGEVEAKVDKSTGEIAHTLKGGHWETIDATKCPHYKPLYDKGQTIRCSYCAEQFTGTRNSLGQFMDIIASRIVYVMSFADEPNKLIMYCDSFDCREKHIARMKNTR